jgi:site-specific DNA recombinase
MVSYSNSQLVPRNGHTLIAAIVARISGCASQKELSLDDQVDHAKEEIAQLYQGPIDYRVIATKGKGERVDRPELGQVEEMIRSGELDLLVMEDVGRLVRGAEAVKLWGIAVDHGIRCLAPNDCLDTADETWEEELITACRDHVGHNSHTSKRLKKKLMNRFKKLGGAVALPITGYVKPEDAKTYHDWRKDDSATEIIAQGLSLLKATLNCSAVADYFNENGFSTGPYCRRKRWNGAMVRRYYKNRLLAGYPGRGFRCTIKHHETGRRVAVKNPNGDPTFLEYPHLAHIDVGEQDEVNRMLDARNSRVRRKAVNGVDPLWQKSRKRTRFPGQHACCWYCGAHYVWGGNGMAENLMCSASRDWRCWNSVGFHGPLAAERLVDFVTSELYALPGFEDQFCELVQLARQDRCGNQVQRWQKLRSDEAALAREQANFTAAIAQYGPRPVFQEQLRQLEVREKELTRERYALERLEKRELCLPQSTLELRQMLEDQFQRLAVESFEFGDLMRLLVPEFHVYLVQFLDGGHPLPRAKVKLALGGIVPDSQHVPGLNDLLTRQLTLDLFERPPQRERIREEAVRLAAQRLTQRQIAAQLATWPTAEQAERPTLPTVQQALALDRLMKRQGLNSPYMLLREPPADYPKLRRHKNVKYHFEPRDGYERPAI